MEENVKEGKVYGRKRAERKFPPKKTLVYGDGNFNIFPGVCIRGRVVGRGRWSTKPHLLHQRWRKKEEVIKRESDRERERESPPLESLFHAISNVERERENQVSIYLLYASFKYSRKDVNVKSLCKREKEREKRWRQVEIGK